MVRTLTKEDLEAIQASMLPHTCASCGWMKPNKTGRLKGQRFCKYPGAVEMDGHVCKMWKLETDASNRSTSGVWVDMRML